jgi:hypothetical protein
MQTAHLGELTHQTSFDVFSEACIAAVGTFKDQPVSTFRLGVTEVFFRQK